MAIKGRFPRAAHDAAFVDIYRRTPSLSGDDFASELARTASALGGVAGESNDALAPRLRSLAAQARLVVNEAMPCGALAAVPAPTLADGTAGLRAFSASWIDTNVKLRCEDFAAATGQSEGAAAARASAALEIYALILKAERLELAKRIGINISCALQEQIVDLCTGGPPEAFVDARRRRADTLNNGASLALTRLRLSDSETALLAAIASGGILALPEASAAVATAESYARVVSELIAQVNALEGARAFVERVSAAGETSRLVWIFDDNGESIFDLASSSWSVASHRSA